MRDQDKQKDVTIRELAAKLALSTATVSRALNHDSGVKKQTRKRVFELAERLGYRTNDRAKNLRNGRSQMIGCIVPRLDNYLVDNTGKWNQSQFFDIEYPIPYEMVAVKAS